MNDLLATMSALCTDAEERELRFIASISLPQAVLAIAPSLSLDDASTLPEMEAYPYEYKKAVEMYDKLSPLWSLSTDSCESEAKSLIAPLVHLLSREYELEDEDTEGKIPYTLLERFGPLSYRTLHRVRDLDLAYTTIPKFGTGSPVRSNNPFVLAMLQVALRFVHIQLFKKMICSASQEHLRQVSRLRDCDGILTIFQNMADYGPHDATENAEAVEWRREILQERFVSTCLQSEKQDRWNERLRRENELIRLLCVARTGLLLRGKHRKPFDDAVPDTDSETWKKCCEAVEKFHTLGLDQQYIDDTWMHSSLAELLWRFTFLIWKKEAGISHQQLLSLVVEEILLLREAKLSNSDGAWPVRPCAGCGSKDQHGEIKAKQQKRRRRPVSRPHF